MKRNTWLLLIGMALAGPGCAGMEKFFWERHAEQAKEAESSVPQAPPPRITADQVDEADPLAAVNALEDELDRAERRPMARPAPGRVNPEER